MIRMETIRIFRVIAIANITSRYHHLKQSNSIASLYIEERPDTIDDKLTCQLEVFGRIKLRMMGAQGVKLRRRTPLLAAGHDSRRRLVALTYRKISAKNSLWKTTKLVYPKY